MTGTFFDTSALTTPVTFNSGATLRPVAVASGNCSGCSTFTNPASVSCSTFVAGGASPSGGLAAEPAAVQPACNTANAMTRIEHTKGATAFMDSPPVPQLN